MGREIYAKLCEALARGENAAILSEYSAAGVKKRLARAADVRQNETDRADPERDAILFTRNGDAAELTELYVPRPRLLILGGGHIALSLSDMGATLDFDTVVFDDRPMFANAERFPRARVICDSFANLSARLSVRRSDYVVVVTRGHRHDMLCLREILGGTLPYYMGMIGSARRVEVVRRQLADEGFSVESIARLHAPIGLRIGAITPPEIALSILAEIVSRKRNGYGERADGAPPRHAASCDTELAAWLADEKNRAEAVVTVVAAQGSTPREAGAKMVVTYEGIVRGTIGGGCAEAGVAQDARIIIRNGGYMIKTIDLTDSAEDDGMVCGGTMTILTEAITPA